MNRARFVTAIAVMTITIAVSGCGGAVGGGEERPGIFGSTTSPGNVFDDYMASEIDPADGFDFPVGDSDGKGNYTDKSTGTRHNGWFIATKFGEEYSLGIHPGEDWNGAGGGNTDLGQDVFSAANGRVIKAANYGQPWGNVITIEHVFYENHEKRRIYSLYAHLSEISIAVGDRVMRRQKIGTIGQDPNRTFPAHLHLELRWNGDLEPTYWPSSNGKDIAWVKENYAPPSEFISSNRNLPIPQNERVLVLVDQETYKMRLFNKGQMNGEYDISLGQGQGEKSVQGDNKTPKGMYFVIGKHRGKFDGPYGQYYGGHWIKINYPNRYDAERGRRGGMITPAQEKQITSNWNARKATLENTRLGGGIGFHGWISEWENDGPRHLSWGCVVMHIYDIEKLYDQIPEGSMVVIF